MKKIFWYMMAFALIGCAFTACNDDDDDVQPITLEVVQSDVDFAAAGGNGTIKLNGAESGVTATSDKAWVTITAATPQAVQFAVAESGEPLIRTATITIKAGVATQTVSILQQPATMDIENQTIEVDPAGQTPTTITYDTSMASAPVVTIPEDGQWLKVTAEAGKLTFVGDVNYRGVRETVVTVEQGWKPVQFTVTQDMVNLVTFEVPEMNDRDAITVECIPTEYMAMTSGNWELQSPNDWITITKTETGCTVEVAENDSGAVRTSEVNVLIDGEVLMTYTFAQKIYSYNFFLGEWTFTHDAGTTTITLRENVKGQSYYMDGLRSKCSVVFNYEVVDDVPQLSVRSQYIGPMDDAGNYFWFCLRDANKKSYNYGTTPCIIVPYNMEETNQTMTFMDNGDWGASSAGYAAHGFAFYKFTGPEANNDTKTGTYYSRYAIAQTLTR